MSQLIILRFVNTFGTMVIASRSYCMILANIAYVYSMAIAQATQILVGYLYGKGDYESTKKECGTPYLYQWLFPFLLQL